MVLVVLFPLPDEKNVDVKTIFTCSQTCLLEMNLRVLTRKALRGSKQEPMPQPASAKNARAARLAKRSGSPSVAPVTEKQKQGVLLLIRATQALYDSVGAHGYQRRDGKIATFPF